MNAPALQATSALAPHWSENATRAFGSALANWFAQHGRDLPWRRTADPYAIWISEMMLQQTQVAAVLDYFRRWMEKFPTVEALAEANEGDVLKSWEGLGYYSRARNLHRAAKVIVEKHGGQIPQSPEVLQALPGIGRYTAGAIAAFGFDLPVPVVDTNVARVLARVFDFREPVDRPAGLNAIWEIATELAGGRTYTSALMELGALLCTPKKPQCLICPVHSYCRTEEPEALPSRSPRPQVTKVVQTCAVIRREDKLFLHQSSGPRWKGMWQFPDLPNPDGEPLAALEYPITRYRVRLEAFAAESSAAKGKWFSPKELVTIPMPAPHRRLLTLLG